MWSTICIPAGDNNDWGSGHHPSVVGRTCDYGMWECTRASLTLFATRFQPITTSVWEDRIPVLHRACWEVPDLGSKPGLRDHTKCTVQNLRMGLQLKRIPGKACLQDYSYIPTSSNVQTLIYDHRCKNTEVHLISPTKQENGHWAICVNGGSMNGLTKNQSNGFRNISKLHKNTGKHNKIVKGEQRLGTWSKW
jgi:hypothetical protein